jgi:hypothetical protein
MLQVFRSDRGELRVFMGKESQHINACGIWRWTGPIPVPEAKPAPSEHEYLCAACGKTFSSSAPGSRGGYLFCAWCYSHPSSENEGEKDNPKPRVSDEELGQFALRLAAQQVPSDVRYHVTGDAQAHEYIGKALRVRLGQ